MTSSSAPSTVVPSAQYLESMKYRDSKLFSVDLTGVLYHPGAKVHIIQHDPDSAGVSVSAVVVARAKPNIQHLFRLRSYSTGEGNWCSLLELPIPDSTGSDLAHPDPTPAFMELVRLLDIPFAYKRAPRR